MSTDTAVTASDGTAPPPASLSMPGAPREGLATIGEKCIHIICDFIRAGSYDTESRNWEEAVSLSRLSRTCRCLYVAVRNLPSVLTIPRPPLHADRADARPLDALLDSAYWSDLAGIVWSVSEKTLVTETDRAEADAVLSPRLQQGLAKLFFWIQDSKGQQYSKQQGRLAKLLEGAGGLRMSFSGWHRLARETGFSLPRCKSVRYLNLFYDKVVSPKLDFGALTDQLLSFPGPLEFASVAFARSQGDPSGIDMQPFRMFSEVSMLESGLVQNWAALQHLRSFSIWFHGPRALSLPDLGPNTDFDSIHLYSCSIPHLTIEGRVHTLKLTFCDIDELTVQGAVHVLLISECNTLKCIRAPGSVHTARVEDCPALVTNEAVQISAGP